VPSLIRRARQHFYVFEDAHVRMIMGMNGYIWIEMEGKDDEITVENRKAMARIANIVHGLNDLCLPIYPSYVHSLLHKSSHLDPKEMLIPDNMLEIVREDDGSGMRW
jgi:exosome complex RNA-binding protein Rrp4